MKHLHNQGNRVSPVRIARPKVNANLLLIVVLATLFAVFHILLRNDIKRMLIETEQARKEIKLLAEQNAILEAEITELTSPENIRSIAEKELGMIDAPNGPVVLRFEKELNRGTGLEKELAFHGSASNEGNKR